MKTYCNTRTDQTCELIALASNGALVRMEGSRDETVINLNTFKRWWKQIDQAPSDELEDLLDEVILGEPEAASFAPEPLESADVSLETEKTTHYRLLFDVIEGSIFVYEIGLRGQIYKGGR